ncbi:hypothetical protein QYE76_003799 [Lolium multiflorum]|uniref:Uncharacterized protein n=1 Tax=Lolium multiflorum TaxID=4521 RepID=A0AAD8RQV4_LOLMU|nr:hypothetical protein QYE76_003799 [Lolium multiflorum]
MRPSEHGAGTMETLATTGPAATSSYTRRCAGQGRWRARHALDDLDAAVSRSSSLLPQSVTKNLSLGAEAFWLAQQRNSGVGFIARYDTKKIVDISHACTCASGFETPTKDCQYLLQCCISRKGRPNDAQVGHTGMLSVLSRK